MYLSPYSWKSWSRSETPEEEDEDETITTKSGSLFPTEEETTIGTNSRSINMSVRAGTATIKPSNVASHQQRIGVDDEPMHVDAAEKIYDTVKGVWGWGKGVFIFSPFLGMAEAVAGKVVETVSGSSLAGVDSGVTGKLQELDDGIINPAIHMVIKIFMGAAHKTEGFVKPIIITVLKPLDVLIKHKPENNTSNQHLEPSPDSAAPPAVK